MLCQLKSTTDRTGRCNRSKYSNINNGHKSHYNTNTDDYYSANNEKKLSQVFNLRRHNQNIYINKAIYSNSENICFKSVIYLLTYLLTYLCIFPE